MLINPDRSKRRESPRLSKLIHIIHTIHRRSLRGFRDGTRKVLMSISTTIHTTRSSGHPVVVKMIMITKVHVLAKMRREGRRRDGHIRQSTQDHTL